MPPGTPRSFTRKIRYKSRCRRHGGAGRRDGAGAHARSDGLGRGAGRGEGARAETRPKRARGAAARAPGVSGARVMPNPETVLSAADVLRQIIKPLVKRIEALEQITRALEAREDARVWIPDVTYPKYAGVSHAGGYWIAQAKTSEQPGGGSTE